MGPIEINKYSYMQYTKFFSYSPSFYIITHLKINKKFMNTDTMISEILYPIVWTSLND